MTTLTDLQIAIDVPASPAEAFDRISQVTNWWGNDLTGETDHLGAEFTIRFGDTYVDFKISEYEPGKTVSWHVTNSCLPFLADKSEWTGTTVRFDVAPISEGSKVTLTHVGLQPKCECFGMCTDGWQYYFGSSLAKLITEGEGTPDQKKKCHE